ncbi:MAG: aldehyde dehydrogenase family protein [Planctomycetota bacterium]
MTNVFRNLAAGEWRSASTDETFENEKPAQRGVILVEFQASSLGDMAEAVGAADAARKDRGRTPLTERQEKAGMAHVNIHSGFKLAALPFGGWKMSGDGLPENGRTGIEFFVERKAVYIADKQ